jgi:hypothetical protein
MHGDGKILALDQTTKSMLHEDGPQQNTGHLGHTSGIRNMATTTTQRHNLDIGTHDLVRDTNTPINITDYMDYMRRTRWKIKATEKLQHTCGNYLQVLEY